MRFSCVILAACASMACTSEPVVELRIDSNLPLVWQEATVLSAEEWFEAVPEARVPVLIVDRDANFTDSGCGPKALGCRDWEGHDRGRVFYEVERVSQSGDAVPEIERRVARHEVGHWLGIRGHLAPGNAMAPSIGDTSHTLTELDISTLRRTWR